MEGVEVRNFIAGDRVIWRGYESYGVGAVLYRWPIAVGQTVPVRFEKFGGYDDSERPDFHSVKASELYWADDSEKSAETVDRLLTDFEPDTSYYEFPGDVQVRDISVHLTACAGQIVQYAARSGRLDGKCKSEELSDRIRDFEKIRDFAQWEIDRLENL